MELSSQQQPYERSQEELAEGLPEGYPPTREHLNPVEPLPKGLQDRMDGLMRVQATRVEKPIRHPHWDHSEDAEADS